MYLYIWCAYKIYIYVNKYHLCICIYRYEKKQKKGGFADHESEYETMSHGISRSTSNGEPSLNWIYSFSWNQWNYHHQPLFVANLYPAEHVFCVPCVAQTGKHIKHAKYQLKRIIHYELLNKIMIYGPLYGIIQLLLVDKGLFPLWQITIYNLYPLVNIQTTMEKHHS